MTFEKKVHACHTTHAMVMQPDPLEERGSAAYVAVRSTDFLGASNAAMP